MKKETDPEAPLSAIELVKYEKAVTAIVKKYNLQDYLCEELTESFEYEMCHTGTINVTVHHYEHYESEDCVDQMFFLNRKTFKELTKDERSKLGRNEQ